MESQPGKLFLGGISQETTEVILEEHFTKYGEITECVIIRQKFTSKARGFGFVTFKDPSVVETVLNDKHNILGRKVDVKPAKPEVMKNQNHDDAIKMNSLNSTNPNVSSANSKIFVGGLPPSITLGEFAKFFEQFGSISDKVIIYNKETNKSRGFGFITFDSEKAANKVLENRFHELNDKQIEVKRADPKVEPNTLSSYDYYNSTMGYGYYGIPGYYETYYPNYWSPYFGPPLEAYYCNPIYYPGSNSEYFYYGSSSNTESSNNQVQRGSICNSNDSHTRKKIDIRPPMCKPKENIEKVSMDNGKTSEMNRGDESNESFTKTNGEKGNCDILSVGKRMECSEKVLVSYGNMTEVNGCDERIIKLKNSASMDGGEADQKPKLMSMVSTDGEICCQTIEKSESNGATQ